MPIREPIDGPREIGKMITWTGIRPIQGDDGRTIRNMLALTYQCSPKDVKVR